MEFTDICRFVADDSYENLILVGVVNPKAAEQLLPE
jgi:hypothetical protein